MVSVVEVDDMQYGYLRLVNEVLTHGRRVAPRGQPTLELPSTSIILSRPRYATPLGVGRQMSVPLASAETTHLTAGISDARQLVNITSTFKRFVNDERLLGAYGPRIRRQMPNVLVALSRDGETRQACAQIWRPNELNETECKDVPCTLSLHWEVRDGKLEAYTLMRSNDVFLGVPYDITMFTRLQLTLAWALGVSVGTYTHTAFSMHVYERDIPALEQLVSPSEVNETIIPAYGVGRHDSLPGERVAQTAVHRWNRARHWAKLAMLDVPATGSIHDSGAWHRQALRPFWTNGLLCSHCNYVLPRTVEFFYALGRDNAWRSRCRRCMKIQFDARPSQVSEVKFAQRCARYGVTPEWYQEQLTAQGNLCAICRRPPDNGRYRDFVIDHDHETDTARGLLCSNCNQALGLMGDDTTRLGVAIDYLRKHSD